MSQDLSKYLEWDIVQMWVYKTEKGSMTYRILHFIDEQILVKAKVFPSV